MGGFCYTYSVIIYSSSKEAHTFMKHSKHLTALLAMILVLLIFGIVFYLYLSALNSTSEDQSNSLIEDDTATQKVGGSAPTEQEIRARLEAVMSDRSNEQTAASTTETFNRLKTVMENQTEPQTDPEEVRARLEAVMNNN